MNIWILGNKEKTSDLFFNEKYLLFLFVHVLILMVDSVLIIEIFHCRVEQKSVIYYLNYKKYHHECKLLYSRHNIYLWFEYQWLSCGHSKSALSTRIIVTLWGLVFLKMFYIYNLRRYFILLYINPIDFQTSLVRNMLRVFMCAVK